MPGEHAYRNRGVAYCPHFDGPPFKGKRVAVVGGGNSGVETAIDLVGTVGHVTLVEFDSALRADAVLQRKLHSLPNTDWLKGTVALSTRGEIEVDARGQTSVPGVFAAGDVTTVPYKQIIIAMGEGSKAALGTFDHLIRTSVPAEQAEKLAA